MAAAPSAEVSALVRAGIPTPALAMMGDRKISISDGYARSRGTSGTEYLTHSAGDLVVAASREQALILNPVSFTPGVATNTQIVFRINPQYMTVPTTCILEWVVTETGGVNSVTPICAPYQIQRIEFGIEGSPTPIQTLYADWFYSKNAFLGNEDLACMCAGNALNMSATTFASESAIAPSGTATYAMPIDIAWFLQKADFQTLKGDCLLLVYPQANPVSAGTGTLQLTSMRFRFLSRIDPVTDPLSMRSLAMTPSYWTYLNLQMIPSSLTLTAGTLSQIRLSGVTGLMGAALVMIRSNATSTTASAMRVFTDLAGTSPAGGFIDVVDASGNSLLGSTGTITPLFLRGANAAYKFPGMMTSVIPHYWLPFCSDMGPMFKSAANTGFVFFDGNQILNLTPGTGFTTGTYTVTVMFLQYAALAQGTDGRLKRVE